MSFVFFVSFVDENCSSVNVSEEKMSLCLFVENNMFFC